MRHVFIPKRATSCAESVRARPSGKRGEEDRPCNLGNQGRAGGAARLAVSAPGAPAGPRRGWTDLHPFAPGSAGGWTARILAVTREQSSFLSSDILTMGRAGGLERAGQEVCSRGGSTIPGTIPGRGNKAMGTSSASSCFNISSLGIIIFYPANDLNVYAFPVNLLKCLSGL